MAKKTIAALKEYFKVGKRPTESQFGDLIDSYVHLDESSEYSMVVEFPANYQVGDYVEFLNFDPSSAGAGGFYEISLAYTRGNIACGATHIAAVSHSNSNIWRECGTINKNNYVDGNINYNFTIDVNGGTNRLRIRSVNTYGSPDQILKVFIKVRSVNKNNSWTSIDVRGNNPDSIPLQPMTNEWNLWVGNLLSNESAKVALKVNKDGNVGIKTKNPVAPLDIQGRILFDTDSAVIDGIGIRGYETMWARGYNFVSSDGTQNTGGFGAVGVQNNINQYYIGKYENQIVSFNPENRQSSFGGNIDVYGDVRSRSQRISDYSPTICLDRNVDYGGYTQGIQTRLSNGTNNWFFGNLGPDLFLVSTGTYDGGNQLVINRNGNAAFKGKVEAKEFLVSTTPTADHVFASEYNLRAINDLEKFITEKNHLPEIPSAKEMTDNGLAIGDFQIKLLQKIEELTLYIIALKKEIDLKPN